MESKEPFANTNVPATQTQLDNSKKSSYELVSQASPFEADRPMNRSSQLQKLRSRLENPWLNTSIRFMLALGAFITNHRIQVFCQPATWAAIVLVICFIHVVFWPLLLRVSPQLHPFWQLLRGMAFCICIYCIVFLGKMNIALPFLIPFGIGVFGLAPHIFALQMVLDLLLRKVVGIQRSSWLAGIGLSLLVTMYFVWDFREAVPIAQSLAADPRPYSGPHAGSVEWILGMHFKYHTAELVGIDGWRPPLHDPAGILGYWSIGMVDPLSLPLKERLQRYRLAFPNQSAQAACVCAYNRDGIGYLEDELFQVAGK